MPMNCFEKKNHIFMWVCVYDEHSWYQRKQILINYRNLIEAKKQIFSKCSTQNAIKLLRLETNNKSFTMKIRTQKINKFVHKCLTFSILLLYLSFGITAHQN